MKENDFVLIDNLSIVGINNLSFVFIGKKVIDGDFEIIVDGKKIPMKTNFKLDKEYVYDRILKQNQNKFSYLSKLPSNAKNICIYFNNQEIIKIRTSKLKRLFTFIKNKFSSFFRKISRLPKIIIKTIKIIWSRHHFLVPPRLIKKYIHSFSNNVSDKNIDELLYNPLILNDYNKWIEEQSNVEIKKLKYNPLISIIIPTYNVSKKLLTKCLDSILNQSYKNFEICIADDYSTLNETIDTLKEYENNKQIKIVYRSKNGHISEASNSALKVATGEFIALVDNDDVLDENALYYMVEKLNEDNNLDMIYSDEDKLDFLEKRCMPHFKPDFSLDTLLSVNYICHFVVIRKSIIDKIGGFRKEYDGAQDYDLFLRIVDQTRKIGHVSKILYHWRMTETSTSAKNSNKNYVINNGKKALEDYLKRNSISGEVKILDNVQMYQINYELKNNPKVSIIIPTKDKSQILKKCIDSIYNKTDYDNYEIIVIDNNSQEEDTFNLLKYYKRNYDSFYYYRLECEFNFSYINNFAISKSTGEYIVLLNNDTEIITEEWIKNMIGYASQDHIGCVGAKLLYPNRTIQHCGVVTGVGGVAMHAYVESGENIPGYFGRLIGVYDWSCVTAACLMIKKEKFEKIKGLDENLKVAYNDVDLCLKSVESGYYNVVLPNVKLLHYESLSRGDDMSESQYDRFKREIDYICDKWGKKLINDKFYNANLSKIYAFRLDKGGSNEKKYFFKSRCD